MKPDDRSWFTSHSVSCLRNISDIDQSSALILGKGPSLSWLPRISILPELTISLNHACEVYTPKIAHFTDVQALVDCSEKIYACNSLAVLPVYPHLSGLPSKQNVLELAESFSILNYLVENERLFVYAGSNSQNRWGLPEFELRYFSVEPAYQLACLMGAKTIYTIGVDGGKSYASVVSKRGQQRLLDNGQKSFEKQFKQLNRLQIRHGRPIIPMFNINTVYVGATHQERLPYRVLKHSIEKYSTSPVVVVPLPRVYRRPRKRKSRGRTSFSFSRFLIPALNGYKGRAVYLDSDMLVLSDLGELFSYPLGDNHLAVTCQLVPPTVWKQSTSFVPGPQFSVMIIDCSKTLWDIDEILDLLDSDSLSYADLVHKMRIVSPDKIDTTLDPSWNSLEAYVPGKTKLLHFTNVPSQPWHTRKNANYQLWMDHLKSAILNGAVTLDLIKESVDLGSCGEHVLEDLSSDLFANTLPNFEDDSFDLQPVGRLVRIQMRAAATIRNFLWRIRHSR